MCTKLNYFTSGSLGVVVLEGSQWMSSVSEDKIINIHKDMELDQLLFSTILRMVMIFQKVATKLILLLTAESKIASFCELR